MGGRGSPPRAQDALFTVIFGGEYSLPSSPGPPETPRKINTTSAPSTVVMRSYQGYYTRSHQNSEVKRLWAGIVLGWVTSREVPVLHPSFAPAASIPPFPSLLLLRPSIHPSIHPSPQRSAPLYVRTAPSSTSSYHSLNYHSLNCSLNYHVNSNTCHS